MLLAILTYSNSQQGWLLERKCLISDGDTSSAEWSSQWKESKNNQSTVATTAANVDTPTPTANQTPKSIDESTQSELVYNISNSIESCQDSNSSISITDNKKNMQEYYHSLGSFYYGDTGL